MVIRRLSFGRRGTGVLFVLAGAVACSERAPCSGKECAALGTHREALSANSQASRESTWDDYVNNRILSPVDNPTYGGIFETGDGLSMSVSPQGYTLNRFELLFDEALTGAGGASFARSTPQRMWPADDSTLDFSASGGIAFGPFWQSGTRLGFGSVTVSARQFIDRSSGQEMRQLTEPTVYTLFPDTAVVPVTAIVVVPTYSGGPVSTMQALADSEFQTLLWDNVWSINENRSTSPVRVTGSVRQVSRPLEDEDHKLNKAGGFIQPDGIWAQCGIQFRLIDVVVISVPEEVDHPTTPGGKWNIVEFKKRQGGCDEVTQNGCTIDGINRGPCVAGTCSQTVGICDDSERQSVADHLVNLARTTPHNDVFGNPLSGMSPLTLPVIFNFSAKNELGRLACSTTAPGAVSDGFSETAEYSLVTASSNQFVLSHELGHFLGLGHPPLNSADYCSTSGNLPPGDARHLMCDFAHQMGPHIQGCQDWAESASFNTLHNCVEDFDEHPLSNMTCAGARTRARFLAAQFSNSCDPQCQSSEYCDYDGLCKARPCNLSDPFVSLSSVFPSNVYADGLTLSPDGLSAYVSVGATNVSGEIYAATRPSSTSTFTLASSPLVNVNSPADERGPRLSTDGLRLYFSTTNRPGSQADLVVSSRPDLSGVFGSPQPLSAVNDAASFDLQPSFGQWEQVLYFASQRPGSHDIYSSTFDGSSFSPAQLLTSVSSTNSEDSHPVSSRDGLRIYFRSKRVGPDGDSDGSIYMAERGSTTASFGAPTFLTVLNTSGNEFPVALSPDECSLFIGSNRHTGMGGVDVMRLYEVKRATPPSQVTMTLTVTGNGTGSVGAPFNCSMGQTCSVTQPYGTQLVVWASRSTIWIGGCAANGAPGLSTDGVVNFTIEHSCTVQFP